MNYENIAEVYAANDKIREKLKETVESLSEEQANFLPAGEKWTVAQIVEHLSMVEEGMGKISARLLKKAQESGKSSDGKVKFSADFMQKIAGSREQKFQAPEMVHPTANRTIAESLAKMEENRRKIKELQPLFETVDCTDFTFPHPAFGDISAQEWLALLGGHEARHLEQIKRLLSQAEVG